MFPLLIIFFVKGTAATVAWYNEVKNYNFSAPGFSSETGHFTQVVWKATQIFGAGFALGDNGHSVYVVAQYSPSGNYKGKYEANVLPEQPHCQNTELAS
jgi:hypothetical protein